MPAMPPRQTRLALAAAAALALLAGCSSFDSATHRIADNITPYKIEIVQGNFVSREQVDALQKGMTREQVRNVLGTPLVTDLFHADRWDYVFTLRRKGLAPQERRLTVFFQGDTLDHWQGDTMPSESEFVAGLDSRRKSAKVPPLKATEEQLRRYDTRPAAPAQPAANAPVTTNYPPLEAPAR